MGTVGASMADAVAEATAVAPAKPGKKKKKRDRAPPLDVAAFAAVMHGDVAGAAHPMLAGRALWAAGSLAKCFPSHVTAEFLRLAAHAVQASRVAAWPCVADPCVPLLRRASRSQSACWRAAHSTSRRTSSRTARRTSWRGPWGVALVC